VGGRLPVPLLLLLLLLLLAAAALLPSARMQQLPPEHEAGRLGAGLAAALAAVWGAPYASWALLAAGAGAP
jgi:hypothetical protein